jgi:hypothetical protein
MHHSHRQEKLPEPWRKALDEVQTMVAEAGRVLYIDNRPVPPRDISTALGGLVRIASGSVADGIEGLERAKEEVEMDGTLTAPAQVLMLLGIGEMIQRLKE